MGEKRGLGFLNYSVVIGWSIAFLLGSSVVSEASCSARGGYYSGAWELAIEVNNALKKCSAELSQGISGVSDDLAVVSDGYREQIEILNSKISRLVWEISVLQERLSVLELSEE